MSYVNLKAVLQKAKEGRYAVGAFNIVDPLTAESVIGAAESMRAPVIVQTSVKTVKLFGYPTLATAVRSLAEKASVPVVLHLDHCKDIDVIRSCIEAGWSSVMIDASELPFDQNVKLTKEVVEMAHPHGVTVEGELGRIVGVEDEIHVKEQESHLADPEEATQFVKLTGVDVLAPAIGTAHGIYRGEPKIAFDLLEQISSECGAFIALHGGTGLSDEVFRRCIDLGVVKINISTQIKHAFRDSLYEFMTSKPDEYEPVKIYAYMRDKVQETVKSFIEKFGSEGKA